MCNAFRYFRVDVVFLRFCQISKQCFFFLAQRTLSWFWIKFIHHAYSFCFCTLHIFFQRMGGCDWTKITYELQYIPISSHIKRTTDSEYTVLKIDGMKVRWHELWVAIMKTATQEDAWWIWNSRIWVTATPKYTFKSLKASVVT